MILVSGTGRSGTSMWMQALGASGLPVLGEAFPRDWREWFADANPRGFFESTLAAGINHTTNPDPATGTLLAPEDTRDLVVKVFLAGIPHTRRVFLDRVIVSVRRWRAYHESARRVQHLVRERAPSLAGDGRPWVRWWDGHYRVLRDQFERGWPARFVSYEAVLADPAAVVPDVLRWIGGPWDAAAAVAAIEPRLKTREGVETPAEVPPQLIEVLDGLERLLLSGATIDADALDWLDDAHRTFRAALAA